LTLLLDYATNKHSQEKETNHVSKSSKLHL